MLPTNETPPTSGNVPPAKLVDRFTGSELTHRGLIGVIVTVCGFEIVAVTLVLGPSQLVPLAAAATQYS